MKRPIDYFKEMPNITLRVVYQEIDEFAQTGVLAQDSIVRAVRTAFTYQMKGKDIDYPLSMFVYAAHEEMARRWYVK